MNGTPPSPQSIQMHNQGIKYLQKGNEKEAADAFRQALSDSHNWIEPLLALEELALKPSGPITAKEHNKLKKALQVQTLKINPDPRALYLLSRHAEQSGDKQIAIKLLEKVVRKNPNFDLASQQLATLFLQLEKWTEAEKLLCLQINKHPNQAHLLLNLSVALLRQNRLKEALATAQEAMAHGSEDQKPSIHVNLGTILQELGQRDEARIEYEAALLLKPNHINALLNLGVIAMQEKQLSRAEDLFRQVLKLKPNDIPTHVNLAGALLLQEKDQEGWQCYEKRLQDSSKIMNVPRGLRPWQGEELSGSLILVHEQGLGDTFQFIRYAALLKKEGIRCYFYGPSKLHRILRRSYLVEGCFSGDDKLPEDAEAWIALMSLAPHLGASPRKPLITPMPYLSISEKHLNHWRTLLGPKHGLRVAIHWQGNPEHEFTISRGRSLPLDTLTPLLDCPEVEWISLQKGPGSEQAQKGAYAGRWHIKQSNINETWCFEDTGAILQCCDGLISSDSGLAHLAGALGVRTWLLLPWLAEWRWGLDGEKTLWYPNHTLLRQVTENDWSGPVKAVIQLMNMQKIRDSD